MRICVVYDCLFPYTIGGAERWYRSLSECLAAEGHEVTYLTLRQWAKGEEGVIPGVRVTPVGPRLALYHSNGRRRIAPPLVFGFGVFWRLLWTGRRYDVVHMASFPYFSLLAAALLRPLAGYQLAVDWHEFWSRAYWRDYLGGFGGWLGWTIQGLCLRTPHHAFCFAHLTARRLRAHGAAGEITVLEGEYAGSLEGQAPRAADPVVVFAGRHIPEKRAAAVVPAVGVARTSLPDLRARILGDGPEHGAILQAIADANLGDVVEAPGFVAEDVVKRDLARALCMMLPSAREGYGMVVVEASALGTPSIVVAGEDNAATELVEDGVNGFVAPSASPGDLAAAILRVHEAGPALRQSTAAWFSRNARRLSLASSLETIVRRYASAGGSDGRR